MACASSSTEAPTRAATSLDHRGLIGFVPVMGLSGLALAWAQAAARMGEVATGVAQVVALLAGALMLSLLGITFWRFVRWPLTRVLDAVHPVRHVFVAAPTVSLILLASVVVAVLLRWTWWGLRSGDLLQPEPNPAPKS